jgi:hypothetical protein
MSILEQITSKNKRKRQLETKEITKEKDKIKNTPNLHWRQRER